MARVHRIDWGRLPCVPLRVTDDLQTILSERDVGWSTEGENSVKKRVTILRNAREQGVTIKRLTEELDVKWRHFKEWASLSHNLTTLELIIGHLPWKDELLHEESRILREKIGIEYDSAESEEDE